MEAAASGHAPVVKQTLHWQAANPDKPEKEGNAPLSWAAVGGFESVAYGIIGTFRPEKR